jgi:trehalose synthase
MRKASPLIKVNCQPKKIQDYYSITPEVVEELSQRAKKLKGLKVTHLNATALGGGVAEMLRSEVPLLQDLGLESSWYIIPPSDQFFEVTKKIHNFFQGKEGELSAQEQTIYLEYNYYLAQQISKIKTDILIIHDPQPAAALTFLENRHLYKTVWRYHGDASTPNISVWNFLLPYLKIYDHYVFTVNKYTHQDFNLNQTSFIAPAIDPLSPKNILIDKAAARQYLKQFEIDINKPLITQISRLDPWKDPMGVINAYRLAQKTFPGLQLALVAQMASDDPEGAVMLDKIKKYAQNEPGIFILVNLPDNDRAINSFQTASDIVLQKSLREGFGLTVTEAMWKGATVIGGNAEGLKLQINHGVNGFLVKSSQEAGHKIIELLNQPETHQQIGEAASLTVKNRFLITHKLLHYLKLFEQILTPYRTDIPLIPHQGTSKTLT